MQSTLARSRLNEHTLLDIPSNPLDALGALVTQWQLPDPDTQTARTLIEQARFQQILSTKPFSVSPPAFSILASATPPLDVAFPLSYRTSLDTNYHATRSFARNNTPIASLPDDVLLQIFEYVAGERSAEPEKRLSWLVVTFVCRFWRHLALASASLWNYIPVRTADIVLTFAKRSRDLPLDLVFEGSSNKTTMLTAARRISVYSLGGRIRSLRFLDKSVHWMEFAQCLPTYLPRLEVLQLDGTEHWTDSATHTPVGHLLGEDAPALRTLSVTGCSFLPDFYPKCSRVTDLRLARNANFLGPDAILEILGSFPHLQTFYFEMQSVNEEMGQLVTSEHAAVDLPELRSLTIVHVPLVAAHILAHLNIPSHASISLAFPTVDGSLVSEYQTTIFSHIHSLSKFTDMSIVVHEKAAKVSVHAGFGVGDRRFCLQYRRDYNFSQHFEGLARIMPSVTTLSVDLDAGRQSRSIISSISQSSWRRFLTQLPCVTELRVSSNHSFSHRALFRVLRDAPVETDDSMPQNCLPALRTLQFGDLVLNEDKCDCGCMEDGCLPGAYGECSMVHPLAFYASRDVWEHDYEYIDSAALWIEGLRRSLEGRKEHGAPPLRIRLTAGSFRKWRSSSCHHPEISRAIAGLVEILEYAPPGN